MSENNGDFGAFLAGFVIGGLVGAATALILAPQSGQETREKIAARSDELRHLGEERFQHVRETAVSYANEYTDKVQEATSHAQEQARIVLDSGKEQANKLREQVIGHAQSAVEDTAEMLGEQLEEQKPDDAKNA